MINESIESTEEIPSTSGVNTTEHPQDIVEIDDNEKLQPKCNNGPDSQHFGDTGEKKINDDNKKDKPLYGEDSGPKIYAVSGNIVTPVIITKNLPDQFSSLPIYGQHSNKKELPQFYINKIREFVGYDLNDEEFEKLSQYCSIEHLRTGDEVQMTTSCPSFGPFQAPSKVNEKEIINKATELSDDTKLCIHKKLQLRIERDVANMYCKKLKYRGIRMMPLQTVDDTDTPMVQIGKPLEPGKELLFRVRIYRPYVHSLNPWRVKSTRHSVLVRDVVALGRQLLSVLRDQFVCANDVGVRLDHSQDPDRVPDANAKTLFPSGFLFINNVFYVDTRPGCLDRSAAIREWARARGLGHFPSEDMCATRLQDLALRLGHPEVYVHQGNCEHLFTFSEVRLLGPEDPHLASSYPLHTQHAQLQSVYCTTCAEFCARWVVVGCNRVPFDPAFFCETCFKLYLYKDGQKIGDFKAYLFRGNELNMLKPQR